jgi:hypothetical protein
MGRRGEVFEYQGALQAQANALDLVRLSRVIAGTAQRVVEYSDQIADIILDVLPLGRLPIEHIQEL